LDVGSRHGKEYKGTVIPTIAEVFATVPKKKKIYIEIKCGTEIIGKLLEEIKKSDLKKEQIVVLSFDSEVVEELKAKSPRLKVLLVVSFKRSIFGRITPSRKLVMESLIQTKADGLSSGRDRISRDFIEKVIEDGYEYHVWTVDDLNTAKRFKEWGAKSITTNIPGHIKKNIFSKTPPPVVDN
jgi:glycerophosphoryl diester phosphodiesterase